MLQAGMIIAGWDENEGGAVYALPLGGTLLKTPFSIGASSHSRGKSSATVLRACSAAVHMSKHPQRPFRQEYFKVRLPCQPSPCPLRQCCHGVTLHHYLGGSGSAYIYGFCDKNWRPDFTEQQCKDFVVKAVTLAIGRDGSSGKHLAVTN